MKTLVQKHYLKILGVVLGAIAGYLYYFFVGCESGGCPITSSPYISVVYGSLLGYLFLDLFKKKKKDETN
jgi:uncharacterized protein YacL